MEFITEHDMGDGGKSVGVINDLITLIQKELEGLTGCRMLKIFRKDKSIESPKYEKAGDSGLDLRSIEDVVLKPRARAVVSTGLIIELPPGHEGQVRPRSGLAAKHGVTVLNTPGTVDNSFRGEVKVILYNTSNESFKIEKGMRIAQLVVAPVARVDVTEVGEEELVKTERGAGGFGSTGHK